MPSTQPSLLRMASPLVISFWMRAVVTLVDTAYASLIGDAAVAAVGLIVPMEFLMIAVWVGLSTGLTSALSRAIGANEDAMIAQYRRVGGRLIALVSPLFTAGGVAVWLVAPRLGLEQEVARGLQVYGTVLIGGSAFTTFWSIMPDSIVKAHQDTRATMWAGIWSNIINVVLNTVFVFVFGWGLFGIALSTVLGRIGGLVYAISRAAAHEERRRADMGVPSTTVDPHPWRAILGLAIPSSLTFGLMAGESALINGLLASTRHPTESIAAYSIYFRVVMFGLQPIIATSVAMLPYAARRVGAGDLVGVQRGLREAGLATTAYSLLVLGPLMLIGAPWLAAALTESALTAEYTTFALRTVPLACLAGAPFLLCRPVFEAMQRGRPGLLMAVVRYLLLTGPLAWAGLVVARSLGGPEMAGLIMGMIAAGAVASAIFYVWLASVLRVATISRTDPLPR